MNDIRFSKLVLLSSGNLTIGSISTSFISPGNNPTPQDYFYQTLSGTTSTTTAGGFGPTDTSSDAVYTTDVSAPGTWIGLGNQ